MREPAPTAAMKSVMIPPLLALMILLAVSSTSAQYNFSSWTADDGLPQNSVYAIQQTHDGYLWFTTLDGLVRFDGVSFTSFSKSNTSQFKSNRFSSLLEDSRGDLWIGTDDGGVVRYHGGEFFSYSTENGLPHNAIDGLLKAKDGLPIVVTRAGMVQWQGDRFVSFAGPPELNYQRTVGALSASDTGVFWYADGTAIMSFTGEQILASQKYQSLSVAVIYEDSQHNVWLGTVNGGLVRFKDGVFTTFGIKDGLPSLTITSIFEDRDHHLWVGTRAGLCSFEENKAVCYTTAQGLSGDYIRSINQDREGNLWVGTDNRGINRLTPRAVSFYTPKDGLLSEITYPIVQDHFGTVWIGGRDGSLTRYQNGVFSEGFRANGGPFESTTALGEDREGRLWIGKLASIQFLKDGKLNIFDPGMSFGGVIVRAIHEDRAGTIWFGTSSGLLKLQNGATTLLTNRDGLAGNDVEAL
ncbi:MAG TPA: two-component regulator propeller domain-containing protein, partial [Pyrinomonadaceae bacterium]|nr:two-component regulator propeller domain-containing protein [Pyrinomonadaceae bacterium]